MDVRSTTVVSNIKEETIALLPTSRSYEDIGKLAPGIRVEGIPDVGGNKTGGGRGTLVNYGSSNGGSTLMLDGVNTDGTAGYFDMGAVEEMIVRPAGNDPEIPTPGMAFQAIVKSGGNTFKGDGLYAWQGRSLQSNNIDDELRAQGVTGGNPMDHYYDANFSFGGRIIRDKIWFFTSVRSKEYSQEVLGFAGAPGADGVYFTADDESGLQSDSENNLTGKVTAQLTSKHRLSYMHHYDYKKTDNRGGNAFRPQEATGFYTLPNHIARGEWLYTMNDRSVFNISGGRSYWNSRAVPYTDNPPSFDNITQRWLGAYVNSIGADSTPAGSLSGRWQFDSSYSYFLPQWLGGTHEFKAGGYFTPGCLQQVPGSPRRGHRGCRQRLPAVFLEQRAVRSAALQLALCGREHGELSERLRARQLADRRAADAEFRPAGRALQRVSAGAVQAGRTVLRCRGLRQGGPVQLELLGAAHRAVLSAHRR